jgi:hypothetical protein
VLWVKTQTTNPVLRPAAVADWVDTAVNQAIARIAPQVFPTWNPSTRLVGFKTREEKKSVNYALRPK